MRRGAYVPLIPVLMETIGVTVADDPVAEQVTVMLPVLAVGVP
jgi:hypothetical protein